MRYQLLHYKERLGLQVCASKVYTSAEFKREKDNFQSLCKNLERTETKRLDEDLGDDEDEDFDVFVNKEDNTMVMMKMKMILLKKMKMISTLFQVAD